jgi:hypothetical protein
MTNEGLRSNGVGITVSAMTDLTIPSTLRQRRNEREALLYGSDLPGGSCSCEAEEGRGH